MTQVNPALSDSRDALLTIQHELETLRPQLVFVADAICQNDDELASGAAFIILGIAGRIEAMTERAAAIIRQERPAS